MTAPTGWLCPSCGKAHGVLEMALAEAEASPDRTVRVTDEFLRHAIADRRAKALSELAENDAPFI